MERNSEAQAQMSKMAACIFCKIVKGMELFQHRLGVLRVWNSPTMTGDIPSLKLFESEKILAFLDIQPLSKGHAVRSL